MGKKLQKIYLKYYSSMIAQAHYEILSIIILKELIKLNVNTDTMIKNEKHVKLNISTATVFLNSQFKDGLIEYNNINCNKTIL